MSAALATITKAERLELAKVIRLRAKVAKDEANAQQTRLIADFEAQLAAQYPENHPAWRQIAVVARQAVEAADEQIAQLCRQLNIPEQFRPGLNVYWHGRGENGAKQRRDELRKAAQTEVAARAVVAKAAIDRKAAELLEELVSTSLSSEQARDFLHQLPSVDALMPRLAFDDVEAATAERHRLLYGVHSPRNN